jgi:hypothetical protein
MNAEKLNYYTMANRVLGFADGLRSSDEIAVRNGNRPRHEASIHMLEKCASMMGKVWNEYATENGYDDLLFILETKQPK